MGARPRRPSPPLPWAVNEGSASPPRSMTWATAQTPQVVAHLSEVGGGAARGRTAIQATSSKVPYRRGRSGFLSLCNGFSGHCAGCEPKRSGFFGLCHGFGGRCIGFLGCCHGWEDGCSGFSHPCGGWMRVCHGFLGGCCHDRGGRSRSRGTESRYRGPKSRCPRLRS